MYILYIIFYLISIVSKDYSEQFEKISKELYEANNLLKKIIDEEEINKFEQSINTKKENFQEEIYNNNKNNMINNINEKFQQNTSEDLISNSNNKEIEPNIDFNTENIQNEISEKTINILKTATEEDKKKFFRDTEKIENKIPTNIPLNIINETAKYDSITGNIANEDIAKQLNKVNARLEKRKKLAAEKKNKNI
jgi:hypothetical protein